MHLKRSSFPCDCYRFILRSRHGLVGAESNLHIADVSSVRNRGPNCDVSCGGPVPDSGSACGNDQLQRSDGDSDCGVLDSKEEEKENVSYFFFGQNRLG